MIQKSPIEWTDYTSNPVKYRDKSTGKVVWGCVRRSPGCAHCYAAALAKRYGKGGLFTEAEMAGYECFLDEKELLALLSPKRCPAGSTVFVGDMTDIFGPWVPFEFLDRLFGVFARRPDVVLQVLTKRPERMREWASDPETEFRVAAAAAVPEPTLDSAWSAFDSGIDWPLPNVWMGASVENQHWLEVRGPELLKTPAAVRYLSCEPLLGPIEHSAISGQLSANEAASLRARLEEKYKNPAALFEFEPEPAKVDWVICGGESGAKARPFNIAWARSLRDQCQAAGVAFYMKQFGAKPYGRQSGVLSWPDYPLKDRKGGSMEEWPADLRVREFPNELSAVSRQPRGPRVAEPYLPAGSNPAMVRVMHGPAGSGIEPLPLIFDGESFVRDAEEEPGEAS